MSQQINLVNPLLLKPRFAFGLREMALGLGLILTAALAWAGYLHYQSGALETQAAQQEARQADAQQELDRLAAATTRPASALLDERVKATQVQVAQREALLTSISGTIEKTSAGFSPHLRALAHSSTEGVWLNGFTLSQGYVALNGSALNAGLLTTYMDRLGKQEPFTGLKFSGLKAEQGGQTGGSKTAAESTAQLDFTLYSGSRDNLAERGKIDGE